jgi:tetratricopeptide (TPR) repeat protein/O-antigen ligase
VTGKTSASSRLLTLGLALALAVYTVVSYPLPLVGEVAASTLLLAIVVTAGRSLLYRQSAPKPSSLVLRLLSFSPTAVFLLVLSTVATIQTLVAQEIFGPRCAIDGTLGYVILAHLLHYVVVSAVVLAGRERSHAVGLAAAMVYTSIFYSPSFATPEAAPPFIPLAALVLVLLTATPFTQRIIPGLSSDATCHPSLAEGRDTSHPFGSAQHNPSRFTPLVLFPLLVLIASLLSRSPHDSLTFLLKLLTLLGFTLVMSLSIRTRPHWERMALLVIILSVVVPVVLALAKLTALAWQLSLEPAVRYRLGLTELGRANLIARTLIVGVPLLVAQAITSAHRPRRVLWWGLSGPALLVFVTCRSWGGWVGVGVTCGFVGILVYGKRWFAWWTDHRFGIRQYLRYVVFIAVVIIIGVGLLGLLRLAPQSNVWSFNGRLFQFRAALLEMARHPLLGIGPGHHFPKSRYTPGLGFLVDTRATLDDPLMSVQWLRGSTRLHTHNLFLEIGVGTGLLGLAAFVWFLVALFRLGLQAHAHLRGQDRVLLTGCLAGTVASLGWGLLDVMEVSSPFFTFPTWALIGLLLAAPRALNMDGGRRMKDRGSSLVARPSSSVSCQPKGSSVILYASRFTFLLFLAFAVVVVPLFGNYHYHTAYVAFQEQHWSSAAAGLAGASRWEPLNAKYQELRGESLINLGQYAEAISAYERAVRLRHDFAPYHAQLGWLHWLRGDLQTATSHFEKAVEMDPREAWRDGLHADLGLAYIALGWVEEAIPLFKETIELDPHMALAPYWAPVQRADGEIDVVLDSVYLEGPSPELDQRILTHLGKANHTSRLFDRKAGADGSLSFIQVLDAVEADYVAARAVDSREAPRLLATTAEAARLVGLQNRASRIYLAFQEAFPGSAYGFRGLGSLYREQGRLEEAQATLEHAVNVSPRDVDSWVGLAEVTLQRGLWGEAERALDTIYQLAPLDSRLYALRAHLYQRRGEQAQAADALRRSLLIQESVPNRLALADLYRQLGQDQGAAEQCRQATDALLRTWPRPLASELWEIGVCLGRTEDEGQTTNKESWRSIDPAGERPFIGGLLLGHVFRARGQSEQALKAYQAAADARPDEGAPHYFLGQVYQALEQPPSAEVEYRQAAQLDPLESLPLLALGRLQWSQGQQEVALESFRAAVEVTPGWGPAHVALGNALLALGDREGATQHYQLALIADGDVREGMVYDFAAHLAQADGQASGSDYLGNDYFTIDGDQRRVLFMHPDSRARYVVKVPEGAVLAFDVATAPESWGQPGDGVTFAVYVDDGQWTMDGVRRLFSTYIDPKCDKDDRRWHSYAVDLRAYGGQTVNVIFETGGGPADDARYDWAGWGAPRLLGP